MGDNKVTGEETVSNFSLQNKLFMFAGKIHRGGRCSHSACKWRTEWEVDISSCCYLFSHTFSMILTSTL